MEYTIGTKVFHKWKIVGDLHREGWFVFEYTISIWCRVRLVLSVGGSDRRVLVGV